MSCPLIKLFKLKGSHINAAFRFEATEPESELNRELSCRSKSAKVGTRFPLENILMNVGNRAREDRWCPDTLLFKWFWLEEAAAAAIL